VEAAVSLRTALLRVLLFGMLAVGVLGMHTVGHASGHDGWVAPSLTTSLSDHMAPTGGAKLSADQQPVDSGHGCPAGSCAAAAPGRATSDPGSGQDHRSVGIVVMCLAVLFGVGLLALPAGLLLRRRRRRRPVGRLPDAGVVARVRPDPVSSSALRLVRVAVLRT
jgi:hypothetical protein